MISKHVHCQAQNDNYGRLASYIADANHAGEKSLMSWCAGTWTGASEGEHHEGEYSEKENFIDDLDIYNQSIGEVLDTQSLNTRTSKEKTYHLMISFRTEDEGKLSQEDFKTIEERFAKLLGFEGHQRHCGVHINTENMHMHIAYNMIHPDKLTRHEPYRDYMKRDKLCRELEKEYNLSVDNGIDPLDTSYKLSAKSAKKEVLTGEESFETFTQFHHDEIMKKVEKANSWEEMHCVFALYGLELKTKGNGLAIKNKKGFQAIKASKFDRDISYKKLTDRFGSFTPIKTVILAKEWYKKKPLQKNNYSEELWKEFTEQNYNEKQKERLKTEIDEVKKEWLKEKIRITGLVVSKRTQALIMKKARTQESLAINQVRLKYAKGDNWLTFLQEKAEQGDEKALNVLRYKKPKTVKKQNQYIADLTSKAEELQKKNYILLDEGTSGKNKNIRTNQTLLERISKGNVDTKILRNGTVIYKIENGGKILDDGQKITYTDTAKNTALDYAAKKWGMRILTPNEKELIKKNNISYKDLEHFKKMDRQKILEKKAMMEKQKELDKQTAIEKKSQIDTKKALEKIKSFRNIEKKNEMRIQGGRQGKKKEQGIQR